MKPRFNLTSDPSMHSAYVCSGGLLDGVIADLEAGRLVQPPTAPWRPDLPLDQRVRLARACGATEESITAAKRGEFR